MKELINKYLENYDYEGLYKYVMTESNDSTLMYLVYILYSIYNGRSYMETGIRASLEDCIKNNDFVGLKFISDDICNRIIDEIINLNNININYNIKGIYLDNFYELLNNINVNFKTDDLKNKSMINDYLFKVNRLEYKNILDLYYNLSVEENDTSYVVEMLSNIMNPTYTPIEMDLKNSFLDLLFDKKYNSCKILLNIIKNFGFPTEYLEYRLRIAEAGKPVTKEDIEIENVCNRVTKKLNKRDGINFLKLDNNEDIKKILWRLRTKVLYKAEKIRFDGKYELLILPKKAKHAEVDYVFLDDYVPCQVNRGNYQNAINALYHSMTISDDINIELLRQLREVYKQMGDQEKYNEYNEAVVDYYKCFGENSGYSSEDISSSLEEKAFELIEENKNINEYINNCNLNQEDLDLFYIYLAKFSYIKGNKKAGENYLKPVIHNKEKTKKVKRILKEFENRKKFI